MSNKFTEALNVADLQHDVLKLEVLITWTWSGHNEESSLLIELVE